MQISIVYVSILWYFATDVYADRMIRFPMVLAPKPFPSAILSTFNVSISHWLEDGI